jgi:TonB dependent receptor
VALRAEYIYDRYQEDVLTDTFEVTTHQVPIGINFFHPSGFNSSVTATYWDQWGRFQRIKGPTAGDVEAGRDTFWTLDAAIGYRLPKRYGFITVGAKNLLDENFKYFDRDGTNPQIQPTRTYFIQLTVALP